MTQVIKLTKGDYTVEIAATKIEEDIQNTKMFKRPIPITKDKQNIRVPITQIVDLKMVTHAFNISGYIEAQTINGDEKTATEVKNILITKIIYPSGIIQLNWRGSKDSDYDPSGSSQYLSVVLEKVKFIDSSLRAEDKITNADLAGQYGTPKRYEVNLSLLRGALR